MPDGANGRGGIRGATAQRCALLLALGLLAACAARQATVTPPPAVPPAAPPLEQPVFSQSGLASLYGSNFQGKRTASGEPLNNSAMTAAHRSLPFHTIVRVTAGSTGRWVKVRINDRGPYVAGRIIDLSDAAAIALGILSDGTSTVRIEVFASDQP